MCQKEPSPMARGPRPGQFSRLMGKRSGADSLSVASAMRGGGNLIHRLTAVPLPHARGRLTRSSLLRVSKRCWFSSTHLRAQHFGICNRCGDIAFPVWGPEAPGKQSGGLFSAEGGHQPRTVDANVSEQTDEVLRHARSEQHNRLTGKRSVVNS